MSSFIVVGIKSYKDLSSAFVTTLLAGGDSISNRPAVTCGVPHGSSTTTYFYLDPFDSDSRGNSSCVGTDLVVILILTTVILAVSWFPRWLVWEPLANRRMKDSTTWTYAECRRFSRACSSCMFFTLDAVFAYRILRPKEWLFDRIGWTHRDPLVDADLKFYYLLYASRIASDSVSIFFESRSSDDFVAHLIHHLTTMGLILSSASVGHTRYGGIIMFFFDWADIPLLAAKAFKYLSLDPTDAFEFIAKRLFEVFAVTFLLTRVVFYNCIVYCAIVDLPGDWINRTCQSLLLALVCLQTYWMTLLIKALIRVITKGTLVDDRDKDLKTYPSGSSSLKRD